MPKRILVVVLAIASAPLAAPAVGQEGSARGLLLVRTTTAPVVPDEGIPTEGYLTYVRIRDSAGRLVYRGATGNLRRRFAAGRYSIGSNVRFCSGTCATLDPPSNHCARKLRLRAGTTLRVRIERSFVGRCKRILVNP